MLLGIKRITTVVNKLATDVVKCKRAVSVVAKSGNLEAAALGAVSRDRRLAHPALGAVSRPRPARPPGARRGSPDPAGVPDRQVSSANCRPSLQKESVLSEQTPKEGDLSVGPLDGVRRDPRPALGERKGFWLNVFLSRATKTLGYRSVNAGTRPTTFISNT
jgi:hypothetical protein